MGKFNFFKNINYLLDKKDKIKFYLIFTAMIFGSILELIGIGSIPIFCMIILDTEILVKNSYGLISTNFIEDIGKKNFILFSSILLILIFLFKNLFIALIHYFKSKLILNLKIKLTARLFDGYLYAPYLFHINRNPSILIRNLNDVILNALRSVESFLNLFLEFLVISVIIILLLNVDFSTTLTIIITLGSFSLIFYSKLKNKFKNWGSEIQKLQARELQVLTQNLGSIKEIKILKREDYQSLNFKKIVSKIGLMSFFQGVVQSIPRLALEVIAIFFIVAICFYYISKGLSFESIVPIISLFGVAAVRMIPSLNVITLSLTSIKFQSPAVKTLIDEIKITENFIKNNKSLDKDIENKKPFHIHDKEKLVLKNINFNYLEKKPKTLSNVDLTIHFGQTVGIIGPSGSGKTTLINIILGLIEPDKGSVMIDNFSIFDNLKSWRGQIGYVPQDTYLLDAPIKNNIAFGIDENQIDNDKMDTAINLSQNKEFISTLPEGINTVVGDRGVRISGGQKQRIGIARALYNNPSILIMDEATSNLDIENENKIIQEINLNKKNRTVIIISHRKNTVKYCDNIFLMKDGIIQELGNFNKIKEKYDDFFSSDN